MKRSEALNAIRNIIEITEAAGIEVYLPDLILEKLEAIGMLPPFSHDKFFVSYNQNGRDTQLANGNEWDQE